MNKVLRDIARQYAPAIGYYAILVVAVILLAIFGRL